MLLDKIQRKVKRLQAITPSTKVSWTPQRGAQSLAYYCEADEIFYGGEPGGGKTDLLLGLALTAHRRSLILRRESTQLEAIKVRLLELTGISPSTRYKLNNSIIALGGCKDERTKYKYQGQPHDLKAFDEVNQFSQTQYEYIKTWCRSSIKEQKCSVVCSFNPPTAPEQQWVIDYLRPWLDPKHPRPARSGEIRYYLNGVEMQEATPGAVSRCFILSSLDDNKYLSGTYGRILDNLPQALKPLVQFGQLPDDPYQVIPTEWIQRSIQSVSFEAKELDWDLMAVDPARGGSDRTVIAARKKGYINYWVYPGKNTPDSQVILAQIIKHRGSSKCQVIVDVTGIGAAVLDTLKIAGIHAVPFVAAGKSVARDSSGELSFINKRAEVLWKLRENLGISSLILPDSNTNELLIELTSYRWKLGIRGLQVESKEEIRKRLGRSPDIGDAIAMVIQQPIVYTTSFS